MQKFLELEEKKMKLLCEEIEKDIEKSEDCCFFMSLTPHTAQCNSLHKLKVRNKIQQVITDMASALGSMSHEAPRPGFSSDQYDPRPRDVCNDYARSPRPINLPDHSASFQEGVYY
jgi:hypothetical protein